MKSSTLYQAYILTSLYIDFASLYPSIIKVHNLSYETINCPHKDCMENKVEGTTHWVCRHRKGLTSFLIGSLRDLRVNYYKHLAKDKTLPQQERQLLQRCKPGHKGHSQCQLWRHGRSIFPLYCLPVADATAAAWQGDYQQNHQQMQTDRDPGCLW